MQVLDPEDRNSLPELAAWYERFFNTSKAIQDVWKGNLTLSRFSCVTCNVHAPRALEHGVNQRTRAAVYSPHDLVHL
jgi:hypothetical protein